VLAISRGEINSYEHANRDETNSYEPAKFKMFSRGNTWNILMSA
jgi:hypothetical protein